jgi:translation initiation factor 2 subunit 2
MSEGNADVEDVVFDLSVKKKKKKKTAAPVIDDNDEEMTAAPAAAPAASAATEEAPPPDDDEEFDLTKKKKKKSSKKRQAEDAADDTGSASAPHGVHFAADEGASAEIEDMDSEFVLDKSKKKRKKKKIIDDYVSSTSALGGASAAHDDGAGPLGANAAAALDEEEEEELKSLTTKKKGKKKKKVVVLDDDDDDELMGVDGSTSSATPSSSNKKSGAVDGPAWMGSDRDYSYDELLSRAFSIMRAKNPSLATSGDKPRMHMKPPEVTRVSTKKSAFTNFLEIAKIMHRQPDHLLQFIMAELGTSGSVDGTNQLIIKGRYQQKQIEAVLRRYIKEYVKCEMCRGLSTILIKENRLSFVCCESCNARRSVSQIKAGFQAVTGKRSQMRT